MSEYTETAAVGQALPTESPRVGIHSRKTRGRRWLFWLSVLLLLIVCGGLGAAYALDQLGSKHSPVAHAPGSPTQDAAANESGDDDPDQTPIPVNTVMPCRKKLVQIFPDQPASIEPFAQAELFAKASGYIKRLGREITHAVAAEIAAQVLTNEVPRLGGPWGRVAALTVNLDQTLARAPRIDYGSFVREGDVLMVIDAPELLQDVAQKESLWRLAETEVEGARSALATFDALIKAAEAQKKQADAEVEAYASDRDYRKAEMDRYIRLNKETGLQADVVEEKTKQWHAAAAAYGASLAKVQTAVVNIVVANTKLVSAQADLRVKQAHVRVARDDYHKAIVLADFAILRAPFDGVLTYRGVDEGDFIQNSSNRENKQVLTVTAIDPVRVVINVQEREAAWVRVGAPATVQVDALDRWHATRPVSRTARALDLKTRTLHVEIDLDNPKGLLMPGMYGHVTMTLRELDNVLAIPVDAVISRASKNYVLLVKDGIAHRQQVHIQFDDGHCVTAVKVLGDKEVEFDGTEEIIVSNKGEIGEGQHVKPTLAAIRQHDKADAGEAAK